MKKTNSSLKKKPFPSMPNKSDSADVVIIGGGPAGLALAVALKRFGLSISLIEKQPELALSSPSMDGRDIALTHASIKILQDLAIWQRIPVQHIFPVKEARVLDGKSPYALNFDSRDEDREALGYLVSNHLIRKAAYEQARKNNDLDLRTSMHVISIDSEASHSTVTLNNGDRIKASLLVAADSRFSQCRRMMGIPVRMRDFGRSAIVCRMKHEYDHNHIAYECFNYGYTLAILPLSTNLSSIVITLPSSQAERFCAMSEVSFNNKVRDLSSGRFGDMDLAGGRYSYPLIATYADRFTGSRFALLGDAAVGMHPVTAHGYNFCLYGMHTLSREIGITLNSGLDIGSDELLARYNRMHRRTTRPLYIGTNALVTLYTNEDPTIKLLRRAILRFGNVATPVRKLITRHLTATSRTE